MCGTFYERAAIWVHQNYEGPLVGSFMAAPEILDRETNGV